MDAKKIKNALIRQKENNSSGNLYYKTQIDFAYNTNHIEGSTITPDETESIYETGTILTSEDKVIVIKDITETKNHFTLFKYMLDTINEPLSEDMIKKYHFILKNGTVDDSDREWFNVGEYKKLKNFVGNIETSLPSDVPLDMKNLISWYNDIKNKTILDIIDFHVRFEKIHPFQDGNGRVGRLLMFKECLKYNIVPFIIDDKLKTFYYRGLKEWKQEKGYLVDTCLAAQDQFKVYLDYFRIEHDK